MLHSHDAETRGRPGEQHIDADERCVVSSEPIPQVRSECTKGADVSGAGGAHGDTESDFGDTRCEVSKQAVLLRPWNTVDNVVPGFQCIEKAGYFLWRVLEIVVDGEDGFVSSGSNTAEECIVLAGV